MAQCEEIDLDDLDRSKIIISGTEEDHKIPTIIGIIFIAVLFGLYGAIYLIDGILPTPLRIADEMSNPNAFVAERARQDLKFLTDIGPRVVGSYENEVRAVEFLTHKIAYIQNQTHANQKLEFHVQTASGFNEQKYSTNVYVELQNVVAKLHAKTKSNNSLLINSHFDSAPTSPGGTDDGINCAVMLELLRKLSRSPETFDHNIIFLFNGAEESGMDASYAFMKHHVWAKEVKAVVNLDSAGAGGRVMLFQTGPEQPWLLDYYRKVPHPNAQVVGEELFQSGMIYTNTDFTVFKRFGLVGLDFAFIKDPYRYHTKYDGFENIPGGSYQHAGDNILDLVKRLANASELTNLQDQPRETIVFYDFLGWFMISYTTTAETAIHWVTSVMSFVVAIKCFYDFKFVPLGRTLLYLAIVLAAILAGWITAGLFITAIAFGVDALQFNMSWYGSQWIVLGTHVSPVFVCSCAFITLLNHFKLTKCKGSLTVSQHTQIQAHILRLIWTIILITGTVLRIRTTYLVLVPVLFNTIAFALIQMLCLQQSIRKWQIIYVVGTIIPSIFLMRSAITLVTFVIPIFGRTGAMVNSELLLGILLVLLTLLITSVYTPLIILLRRPYILLLTLCGFFLIFFIMVFTPLGFPYSGNMDSPKPQRLSLTYDINNMQYQINNTQEQSSKFITWCNDGDPRNTLRKFEEQLHINKSSGELNLSQGAMTWIPSEKPMVNMFKRAKLKLNSATKISKLLTAFNFTASGSSLMNVDIFVNNDTILTAVRLQPPAATVKLKINSSYSISYMCGKRKIPLNFTLYIQKPANLTRPIFKVVLTGIEYNITITDAKSSHMQYYTQYLKKLPEWVNLDARTYISEIWIY